LFIDLALGLTAESILRNKGGRLDNKATKQKPNDDVACPKGPLG
jgi:hypothetical protein